MRMRRFGLLPLLLALLIPLVLRAQHPVQLGGQRFVPEQNLARGTRLPDVGRLGAALGGQRNALVQLRELPTAADIQALAARGITLGDYLGGHAYHALVAEGAALPSLSGGNRLTALVAVRPEWKLHPALRGGAVPEHARAGADGARVVVRYAANATPAQVAGALGRLGLRDVEVVPAFRAAYAEMPLSASEGVASLPWVLAVNLFPPPPELLNSEARILGRASVLGLPAAFGGRGLEGEGVRIGIWDASVTQHVDFGNRVHVQEYESFDDHGTHVAGTILGAGIKNPDALGMAPRAEAWTYNFNVQKNGLSTQQEMAEAQSQYGITITQNSYGLQLARLCQYVGQLGYRESDFNLDQLACEHPTLTHIFAAGNDQGSCASQIAQIYGQARYGTGSNRSKNSIYVGALDRYGLMTDFSSWGPTDDGRLYPTICAKGEDVLSTVSGNGYASMDGTSMACPAVTGHAALISERYAQLHQGGEMPSALLRAVLANTAADAGRPGPDFQYGYGVMDAERAVVVLENGWHHEGVLEAGKTFTQSIEVPKGCAGFRVMLAWNDPAVAKVYSYGTPVLVNDLNLRLSTGKNSFLPWVCNPTPGHLEDAALRGVDSLNNLEQITLTADELEGVDRLTVTIDGKGIANGSQPYALTWYFEEPSPRLIAPAGGEALAAGDLFPISVENVAVPYRIELSYDAGASWAKLGEVRGQYFNLPIRMPASAQLTEQGMLRIIDADGRVAKSPHTFSIAPQPRGLRLEQNECGTDGWKLSWEKAEGATLGYAVLLANPDAETVQFVKIGETNAADQTEFLVQAARVAGVERPVLSVAALLPNGAYGKRAVGIVANYSVPLRLLPVDLPFAETFSKYPSRYLSVQTGENIEAKYINSSIGNLPAGSNLLVLACRDTVAGFDRKDYFNETKNSTNMGRIRMCELDLAGIPPTERVLLHISGALGAQSPNDLSTARMRLFAGADGKQPIANQLGEWENRPTLYDQEWVYELPNGVKHQIVIEFAGYGQNDLLAIGRFAVERPTLQRAISLQLASAPPDGPELGIETYRLAITNRSTEEQRDLLVKAYRGDKWVSQAVVTLKGLEMREIEIPVDLSTANPLGELIPLRFECTVDPLNPSSNARLELEAYNMGQVIPMGTSRLVNSSFGLLPIDPKVTHTVKGKLIFTDNGGLLRPYTASQQSTIKFLPSNPSMKVRVRFTSFKTTSKKAGLTVYTTQIPGDLKRTGKISRGFLMGEEIVNGGASREFVSEAADGGVTLFFQSVSTDEGNDGWVAEVDMVPAKNPLALVGLSATGQGESGVGSIPVKLKIQNHWLTAQKDVVVRAVDSEKYLFEEVIPTVEPGEHEYTLTNRIAATMSTPSYLRVALQGDDTDATDNEMTTFAIYDRYCIPPSLPKKGAVIQSISALDRMVTLNLERTGLMRYALDEPIVLYKGEPHAEIEVGLGGRIPEGYSLAAFVDWDNNGIFEESEKQIITLKPGAPRPVRLTYDLSGVKAGLKRVRLMVGASEEVAQPCGAISGEGDALDVSLHLVNGVYPASGDLALSYLNIGESGKNLSHQQPISFILSNRSNRAFSGIAKVRVQIDDLPPVVEELNCLDADSLAPYTGEMEFTLATTADFTAIGEHRVEVALLDNPVEENNVVEAKVYSIVPRPGGFYMLDLKGNNSKAEEWVQADAIGSQLASSYLQGWSMEMDIRLDRPQFSTLAQAQGFKLYTTYRMENNVPDNALALILGRQTVRYTPAQSLMPGRWHHITISVSDIERGDFDLEFGTYSGTCNVAVYIDGQKADLRGNGGVELPNFGPMGKEKLRLVGKFDGQIKLLRTYDHALGISEIHRMSSVRDAEGNLPEGCLAEFTFDEGPKNKFSFSGTDMVEINAASPQRLEAALGGIWKPVRNLIGSFRFNGQVGVDTTARDAYTVTFDNETNPEDITGTVEPEWEGTTLSYNDAPITESTRYDFTKPVVIHAKATVFGRLLEQTVTLTFRKDASRACDLLSVTLEKAKNDGLTEDVHVVPITQSCAIRIAAGQGTIDPTRVTLTFGVSYGARLMKGDSKLTSGESTVDLTHPIALTVVAANGMGKNYEVYLARENSITWSLAKNQYTYGDGSVEVNAVASSHRPITFTSSAPHVASVANGQLVVGTPGETVLTALQPANDTYAAAAPVTQRIVVGKKAITVKAANTKYPRGYPVQPKLEYTSLVNLSDARSLPDPFSLGCFTVKDGMGNPVNITEALPVGRYTVEPVRGKSYETDYYTITPEPGQFTVEQAGLWSVTLRVTDGTTPLADASVVLGGEVVTTGSNGIAQWYLPAEHSYAFVVRRDGYMMAEGRVEVLQQDVNQEIRLQAATLELKYTVDPVDRGAILGERLQRLAPNTTGTPVVAVPKPGFAFSRWDDGITTPQRQDGNLTGNVERKALFTPVTFTLSYSVGEGGRLASGRASQQIAYNGDGEEVQVEANPGFYFQGWSDGEESPARTDKGVKANITATALFGKYRQLPCINDFESGNLGEGWYTVSRGATYNPWSITSQRIDYETAPLEHLFAYCSSDAMGEGSHTEAYLYSPRLLLGGDWNSTLLLSQQFLIRCVKDHEMWLEVRMDNGEWTTLFAFPKKQMGTKPIRLNADTLSGKNFIQFRWKYKADWAYTVEIDNIAIVKESVDRVKIRYAAHPAGKGRFAIVNDRGRVIKDNITEQEVVAGEVPSPVKAFGIEGYEFSKWEQDDSPDPIFQHLHPVYSDENYTAHFQDASKVAVTYNVIPPDAGTCQVEGVPVTTVEVSKGENPKPVTAVAATGYVFAHWSDNGDTLATHITAPVHADATITAVFRKMEAYPARFTVADEAGVPLANVAISIAGETITTTADGTASTVARLKPGVYPYSAELADYVKVEGNALVSSIVPSTIVMLSRPRIATFTVSNVEGRVLPSAKVSVNGNELTTGADGRVAVGLPSGTFIYRVVLANYEEKVGMLTVGGKSLEERVVLRHLRAVTFTVKEGETPLPNAQIRVGNQTLTTDSNGAARTTLASGAKYPYTAVLQGYSAQEGEIELLDQDLDVPIELHRISYRVSFHITDGYQGLKDATVEIAGKRLASGGDGSTSANLLPGDYHYSVSLGGYTSVEGDITAMEGLVEPVLLLRNYTITFVATGDDGIPLPGAKLTINSEEKVLDATGSLAISLAPGAYLYQLEHEGYFGRRSSVTVTNRDATERVVLASRERYPLTFTVTDADGGAALNGAAIEIAGKTLKTDAKGVATISLPNGTYPYTAKMDGYEDKAGNITVSGAAVEEAVALTKKATATYTITFTVTEADGGAAINGATIEINGQTLTADASGKANIDLPNGTYPYTVTLDGYRTANGTALVQGEDLAIPVVLAKEISDAVESSLLAGVEAYPNPCDAELHLRNVAALRSLRVVNALGQTVLTRTHDGAETMAVTTSALPAGVYLLHLTGTAGGIRTLRFVKR